MAAMGPDFSQAFSLCFKIYAVAMFWTSDTQPGDNYKDVDNLWSVSLAILLRENDICIDVEHLL